MMRGWYSAADLPNLAYATGAPRLGLPQQHARRPLRCRPAVVYWLLNRAAPLEWWVTVLIRLVFQALAPSCSGGSSVRCGPPAVALMVLRCMPQRLPGARNSGAQQRPRSLDQPGVSRRGAARARALHPRSAAGRRRRRRAPGAPHARLRPGAPSDPRHLPVVSIAFLSTGPWRGDWRRGLSCGGLALLAGALACWRVLPDRRRLQQPVVRVHPARCALDGRPGVAHVLGAALLGGPWRYYVPSGPVERLRRRPIVLAVPGQLALLGTRRPQRPSLGPGGLGRLGHPRLGRHDQPAPGGVESVVVACGEHPRRNAIQPLPSRRARPGDRLLRSARRATLTGGGRRRAGHARPGEVRARPTPGGGRHWVAGVSACSRRRDSPRFLGQPCAGYTAALLRDVGERGPGVQVHDTLFPEAVVPYVSEMYVSDLVALGGAEAAFGGQSDARLAVDDEGGSCRRSSSSSLTSSGRGTSVRRPRLWQGHDAHPAVNCRYRASGSSSSSSTSRVTTG